MKKMRSVLVLTLVFTLAMCLTFPVTAAEQQVDSKRIDEIVFKTLNGEIDFDDVLFVLENDEKKGMEILNYLDTIAVAAEVPIDIKCDTYSEQSLQQSLSDWHYTVEYDSVTGQENIVFEDFLDVPPTFAETEPDMSGIENLPNLPIDNVFTRSFSSWTEANPQNYADTKSIFKLYILSSVGAVYHGSAFRISNNYLATAGHCIYNFQSDFTGWAKSVLCVPAYRPTNPTNPLGESYAVSTNMAVGGNWKNQDWTDDWGILQLKNPMSTGYLGRRCVGDNTNINGKVVRSAGYPAGYYEMSLSWGKVTTTNRRIVNCDCIGMEGMSGSPITDRDGYVIGILNGQTAAYLTTFVKFDNWLFNKLNTYD